MVRLPLPDRIVAACLPLMLLAACGSAGDGPVEAAFIDTPAGMFGQGIRLSAGAQHLRGATAAGLVSLDPGGEVVPALADRWIVTEDGLSFIFRLRDGTWSDGRPLTAESVRSELRRVLASLRGTSLGIDLAPVDEVRAMAGRVVEIRLSAPVPMLLQLLAQPELSLDRGGAGMGPMDLRREGDLAVLEMKPPAARGEPESPDWQEYVRPVRVRALPGDEAIAGFYDGEYDLVLGGSFDWLPLVETGPLSRGAVRLDPMVGLFGLRVSRAEGFLASAENREALALALDRAALIEPFGVGGWLATTRVVPPGLPDEAAPAAERWADIAIEDRRAVALRRVAAWRAGGEGGQAPRLTIAIGQAPGERQLLSGLAAQFATIGLRLERAAPGERADLLLVDQPARYAGRQWFLNQFNCTLRRGLCSSAADELVRQSRLAQDPADRARLLAGAEIELTRANVYIPLGSPIRFSLARGSIAGLVPNARGYHPLPSLAVIPR